MQALMRKYLSCRNSSNSINDLTVGNNEAIATILIYTRVIEQQARSYDIGIFSAWVGFELCLQIQMII